MTNIIRCRRKFQTECSFQILSNIDMAYSTGISSPVQSGTCTFARFSTRRLVIHVIGVNFGAIRDLKRSVCRDFLAVSTYSFKYYSNKLYICFWEIYNPMVQPFQVWMNFPNGPRQHWSSDQQDPVVEVFRYAKENLKSSFGLYWRCKLSGAGCKPIVPILRPVTGPHEPPPRGIQPHIQLRLHCMCIEHTVAWDRTWRSGIKRHWRPAKSEFREVVRFATASSCQHN